jgi:hypothetical protein
VDKTVQSKVFSLLLLLLGVWIKLSVKPSNSPIRVKRSNRVPFIEGVQIFPHISPATCHVPN